jgi:hypothetical protein
VTERGEGGALTSLTATVALRTGCNEGEEEWCEREKGVEAHFDSGLKLLMNEVAILGLLYHSKGTLPEFECVALLFMSRAFQETTRSAPGVHFRIPAMGPLGRTRRLNKFGRSE